MDENRIAEFARWACRKSLVESDRADEVLERYRNAKERYIRWAQSNFGGCRTPPGETF